MQYMMVSTSADFVQEDPINLPSSSLIYTPRESEVLILWMKSGKSRNYEERLLVFGDGNLLCVSTRVSELASMWVNRSLT